MTKFGSKFWKVRKSPAGRKLIFQEPEDIWKKACEYFEWAHETPLIEEKVSQYQGDQVTMMVHKARAMTIGGLCLFMGIGRRTWEEYREREGYEAVCEAVEQVIWQQKFEGAAADLFNANLISRELGLAERTDNTHSGNLGLTDMTEDALDDKIQQLLREYEQSAKT